MIRKYRKPWRRPQNRCAVKVEDICCSWERRKGGNDVPSLQLITGAEGSKHQGEISSCSFGPDSMFVLSGGWDGYIRLWETTTGVHVTALQVSNKPVSTCGVSPDGKQWLAGTLEGMLARWDALTHQQVSTFLPHTSPIPTIAFPVNDLATTPASCAHAITFL